MGTNRPVIELRYDRYSIHSQTGTIPLTDTDIHAEDLKMLKFKIQAILHDPLEIINILKLKMEKLHSVKSRLIDWEKLVGERIRRVS